VVPAHDPVVIFAETHGKLGRDCSRAHERLEDMLTSTVFGLLRYIPNEDGLLPLLRRARFVTVSSGGISVAERPDWLGEGPVIPKEPEFWPRWGRYGEPDLLLVCEDEHGRPVRAILVEAKLYSGKSGSAGEDDASLADPEVPDPDQLVRYWQGLAMRHGGAERTIIYLTSHGAPPTPELVESLRREPSMHLAWLSWRDVWRIADGAAKRSLAARDLATLLRHKGLYFFAGFSGLRAMQPVPPSARFWLGRRWFDGLALSILPPSGVFSRKSRFMSQRPNVGSGRFFVGTRSASNNG
jgi:hypothetical protein